MSRFIQLHLLTSYPPANLNRDDLGRPKTAIMGGETRLRISSQSLKRAWRTSEVFENALKGYTGKRTKLMGVEVYKALRDKGVKDKAAQEWATKIAAVFGKLEGKTAEADSENEQAEIVLDTGAKVSRALVKSLSIKQLAHISPEERAAIDALVETLAARNSGPNDDELNLLRQKHTAADIALFGRMLADAPRFNMEAAAQVAHAISVHKVVVEDDFFTAVDDLNTREEDVGAGHMGETEFAAGLFYQYICIDKALLMENLDDAELVKKTLAAFTEAAARVAPTGKQNSFASRACASFILAEKGNQQPRSLSVAFIKPVTGYDGGMLENAISALNKTRENMNKVYGPCADFQTSINVLTGEGSLKDLIAFVAG